MISATITTSTDTTNKMKKNNNTKKVPKIKVKKAKMTKEERRIKYTNIARERRDKKKHSNTICYSCRKKGHTVSECPFRIGNTTGTGSDSNSERVNSKNNRYNSNNNNNNNKTPICYKCGKTDHSLNVCPLLTKEERNDKMKGGKLNYHKMELPFATCFICKEQGHLSSQCKLNSHGIYIGGSGGCRFCGKNDHLYVHCTERGQQKQEKDGDNNFNDNDGGADIDQFLEEEIGGGDKKSVTPIRQKKKKKVVQF